MHRFWTMPCLGGTPHLTVVHPPKPEVQESPIIAERAVYVPSTIAAGEVRRA
jgi:hypothetical protein